MKELGKEVQYGAYQIALTSAGTVWGVRSDVHFAQQLLRVQGMIAPQNPREGEIPVGNTANGSDAVEPPSPGRAGLGKCHASNVFTLGERGVSDSGLSAFELITASDALSEVKPEDGSLRLLASTERRPVENPLDGKNFQTIAIAAGPGGAPVIAYNDGANSGKIREIGNRWPLLLQGNYNFTHSIQAGRQTLLGVGMGVWFCSIRRDQPQPVLTAADGSVQMAFGWTWPEGWSGNQFAYRAGELFSLAQDDLRWWYPGGPTAGVLIRLNWKARPRPPEALIPAADQRGRAPAAPGARGRRRAGAAPPAPTSPPTPDAAGSENTSGNFEPPLIGNEASRPGSAGGYRLVATPGGLIITDNITGLDGSSPTRTSIAYRAAASAAGAPTDSVKATDGNRAWPDP